MDTFIKSRVIKVGNSQGIRIPKLLLEQSGIQENVKIEVRDRQIVITAAEHAREGWAEAFAAIASDADEPLLDDVTGTSWDEAEWEW
jgi:antitoxin MazE